MIKQSVVMAYAVLVRAGQYVLGDDNSDTDGLKPIPEKYRLAVAEYIVANQKSAEDKKTGSL